MFLEVVPRSTIISDDSTMETGFGISVFIAIKVCTQYVRLAKANGHLVENYLVPPGSLRAKRWHVLGVRMAKHRQHLHYCVKWEGGIEASDQFPCPSCFVKGSHCSHYYRFRTDHVVLACDLVND